MGAVEKVQKRLIRRIVPYFCSVILYFPMLYQFLMYFVYISFYFDGFLSFLKRCRRRRRILQWKYDFLPWSVDIIFILFSFFGDF